MQLVDIADIKGKISMVKHLQLKKSMKVFFLKQFDIHSMNAMHGNMRM